MMARRHNGDEDDEALEGASNSHTRWVVGVVSAAIVSLLGWLLVENYGLMQTRIRALEAHTELVAARVYAHDAQLAEIRAHQANMIETQRRIEDKLDAALRARK